IVGALACAQDGRFRQASPWLPLGISLEFRDERKAGITRKPVVETKGFHIIEVVFRELLCRDDRRPPLVGHNRQAHVMKEFVRGIGVDEGVFGARGNLRPKAFGPSALMVCGNSGGFKRHVGACHFRASSLAEMSAAARACQVSGSVSRKPRLMKAIALLSRLEARAGISQPKVSSVGASWQSTRSQRAFARA